MKLFIKLVLFIVVLAVAAPYVMKGKDGKPLMEFNLSDTISSITNIFKAPSSIQEEVTSGGIPVTSDKVFKWKDENGRWHFSDKPVDGQQVSTHIIPKANILAPVKIPGKEEEKEEPSATPGIPVPMTAQNVPKLIDDAKNVQKLLNDRQSQLDKHMGQ